MGIKTAFFSKKLRKIAQQLKASPTDPHSLRRLRAPPPDTQCETSELQYTSLLNTRLPIKTFSRFNYWFRPFLRTSL